MQKELFSRIKIIGVYGSLSLAFSLFGFILPYATHLHSPLDNATPQHIFGHILWGVIAGIVSFSLRYAILTGVFAIILDADHLVNFVGIEAVNRMGHSIPFAIMSAIIMIVIFGRKQYLLGAISFAAVFAHISFDIFIGLGHFPIFIPFSGNEINFQGLDWILFEGIGISIVLSCRLILKYKKQLIL